MPKRKIWSYSVDGGLPYPHKSSEGYLDERGGPMVLAREL